MTLYDNNERMCSDCGRIYFDLSNPFNRLENFDEVEQVEIFKRKKSSKYLCDTCNGFGDGVIAKINGIIYIVPGIDREFFGETLRMGLKKPRRLEA